jgi:hypothetical protein
MPYSTFLGLLGDPSFANFMSSLQEEYEKTEGPIFDNKDDSANVSDKDDNEDHKEGVGNKSADDDGDGDGDDDAANKA